MLSRLINTMRGQNGSIPCSSWYRQRCFVVLKKFGCEGWARIGRILNCDGTRIPGHRGIALAGPRASKVPSKIVAQNPQTMEDQANNLHDNLEYPMDQLRTKMGASSLKYDVSWAATPNLAIFNNYAGRPSFTRELPVLSPHFLQSKLYRMCCVTRLMCVLNESCRFTVLRDIFGLKLSVSYYTWSNFDRFRQPENIFLVFAVFQYSSVCLQHPTTQMKAFDMEITATCSG